MVWFRAVWIFLLASILAVLAAWLADAPGLVLIEWLGWEIQTNMIVMIALIAALFALFFLLQFLTQIFVRK